MIPDPGAVIPYSTFLVPDPTSLMPDLTYPVTTLLFILLLLLFRGNSYGAFSIGHLVIWTYELSAFDMEVAFLSLLTKTTNSIICCKHMKGNLIPDRTGLHSVLYRLLVLYRYSVVFRIRSPLNWHTLLATYDTDMTTYGHHHRYVI